MEISLSLTKKTLADILYFVSNWNSAVPSQEQNLLRLRMFRELFSGLDVSQRASLASNHDAMDHLLKYVPSKSMTGSGRYLDWGGIDPSSSNYPVQQEVLTQLLHEQESWLSSGLIPQTTASSSEWPAVSVIHACAQLGQCPDNVEKIVSYCVERDIPSVLEALISIVPHSKWETFLSKPLYDNEENGSLFFSILQNPIAAKIRPYLSPQFVNSKKGSVNGFFGSGVPIEEIGNWVQSGMDPCARDKKGRFPEEWGAGYSPGNSVPKMLEMNKFRPEVLGNLARWRTACASIQYSKPSTTTGTNEKKLLKALLGPVPHDPDGISGETVLEQIKILAKDNQNDISAFGSNLLDLVKHLEDEGQASRWLAKQDGPESVLGFILLSSFSGYSDINIKQVQGLLDIYAISDELALVSTLGASPESPSTTIQSTNNEPVRKHHEMIKSFINTGKVECPQTWVKVLPSLHYNLAQMMDYNLEGCLPLVNVLAHVLPHLSQRDINTASMKPLLTVIGCINSMASVSGVWDEFRYLYNDTDMPEVDRGQLEKILSNHFANCGSEHIHHWWTGQNKSIQLKIERVSPEMASTLKAAALGQVAAQTNKARPGTSQRAM